MVAKVAGFRDSTNFRDLGGYVGAEGRRVVRGRLFRSGGLYLLNEQELAQLKALKPAAIMDLRTTQEVEINPDPFIAHAHLLQYSGLEFRGGDEIDFSPEGMHRLGDGARDQYEKFSAYYREMPFDNEAFRNLVSAFEQGEVPLVFHCASGKDRTGVAAMIILLALGVDEQQIMEDYLYSNTLLAADIEAALKEHAANIAHDELAEKLIRMEAGVLEATGRSVLDEMLLRYGSYERYLEAEFGLAGARLDALRARYLEEQAA